MVHLQPMKEDTFQHWMIDFITFYSQENVTSGRWREEDAVAFAKDEIDDLIPDGLHTPDHHFYTIVADDMSQEVGVLWIGIRQRRSGRRVAYIYQIEIAPQFRRHGYGRQTLSVLEQLARGWRVDEIGLHAHGHNKQARSLYEQFGFIETDIEMAKHLTYVNE